MLYYTKLSKPSLSCDVPTAIFFPPIAAVRRTKATLPIPIKYQFLQRTAVSVHIMKKLDFIDLDQGTTQISCSILDRILWTMQVKLFLTAGPLALHCLHSCDSGAEVVVPDASVPRWRGVQSAARSEGLELRYGKQDQNDQGEKQTKNNRFSSTTFRLVESKRPRFLKVICYHPLLMFAVSARASRRLH